MCLKKGDSCGNFFRRDVHSLLPPSAWRVQQICLHLANNLGVLFLLFFFLSNETQFEKCLFKRGGWQAFPERAACALALVSSEENQINASGALYRRVCSNTHLKQEKFLFMGLEVFIYFSSFGSAVATVFSPSSESFKRILCFLIGRIRRWGEKETQKEHNSYLASIASYSLWCQRDSYRLKKDLLCDLKEASNSKDGLKSHGGHSTGNEKALLGFCDTGKGTKTSPREDRKEKSWKYTIF